MDAGARVYVAGAGTFIGGAIARALERAGLSMPAAGGAGAADPESAARALTNARPDYVFVAAGRTAGIAGNLAAPADLMLDNLLTAGHLIPAAWRAGVKKLLYVSSSCTYPKDAPQPMHPSSLWTGPLEPTSAAYAVAKLAGVTLADAFRRQHGAAFISGIAADAYGPGDDFSPTDSHVVAALMRRMHEARETGAPHVQVWGSGTPQREFIFVDDLADACLFAMRAYDGAAPINLGTGQQTSIRELAETIREVVGYRGALRFDTSRPDGMPFKGLDSSELHRLGWRPRWTLRDGLEATYRALLV
jgi:GDP-L-fucose synthase